MLNRRVTRTVLAGAETTDKTNSIDTDQLAFVLTTSDRFYLGFYAPFASRHFQMKTPSTGSRQVVVKYWNGQAFSPVLDLVDQTLGFTRTGMISWENQDNWTKKALAPVSDVELFWLEISVSADMTAGSELQSVLNLFSDDNLLAMYYPELASDANYKPQGQTDFTVQHLAAKNKVVLRLKQRSLIQDESQIIDIDEVALAATHVAAEIILTPIATNDALKDLLKRVGDASTEELNAITIATDRNNDGKISEGERQSIEAIQVFRR